MKRGGGSKKKKGDSQFKFDHFKSGAKRRFAKREIRNFVANQPPVSMFKNGNGR